ncbi:hypothetical protein E4T80_09770 [Muribacter muris]|uniref:Uncharacterized protein n=1 Tax=Muribacter muris TaxID=67855 RepID=A0A4Y9JSM0_9PAST|nr:hypothetical protein [Muribacter muris]MBF0785745.1 hypothetical protein [Muribacter muris]MBF0828283.1 hypothetical protein [Muribacter muris]TFV08568.1 hypothetical protein E4T80_09770 [Muribacter muris]
MLNVTYELKMKIDGMDFREYYDIKVRHPEGEVSPFDTFQKFLEYMKKEVAALNLESDLIERKPRYYRELAVFKGKQNQ